jgi:cytochrome c553
VRTLLKWIARLAVAVVILILALVGYVYVASGRRMAQTYSVTVPSITFRTDADALARGKYLVETVSSCVDCHDKDLGGKVVVDSFAMGRLVATNLTRGRGGLPADYRDEDFVRALLHGVKRDGHTVVLMPSADFRFTEADAAAILAYVKSMPPVDRELPAMKVGPMPRALGLFTSFPLAPAAQIDHERAAFLPAKDPTDPAAAGESLVAAAGCRGCHGPDFTGGSGPPPGGTNITPVGIGSWTEQDFVRALREHKRPDGSTISDAMPRTLGGLSDDDLHRIFAFLKTVPAAGTPTPRR